MVELGDVLRDVRMARMTCGRDEVSQEIPGDEAAHHDGAGDERGEVHDGVILSPEVHLRSFHRGQMIVMAMRALIDAHRFALRP